MIPRPLVCCIYVTVPCGTMIFDFWFDFCWRECWKNKMFLIVYMTWIEIKFYLLTFQKRLLIIVMYIETLNFPSMYSLQCADFPKVMIAKYSKSEYFLNDNGIVYIFRELITFICHIFMQELWQIIVITHNNRKDNYPFCNLAKYFWHYIKHQLYNGHGVSAIAGMLTWEYFIQPPVSFEIEICTHFCGFSISLGLFVCLEFWLFCFSILTGVILSIKWF